MHFTTHAYVTECNVIDAKKELVFMSITSTKALKLANLPFVKKIGSFSWLFCATILLSTIFQGSCHGFHQWEIAPLNALLLVEEDILQIYYSKCCDKLIFSSKHASKYKEIRKSASFCKLKLCMYIHTARLSYKVKLVWQDLACFMQETHECPREFPREWFAYLTALIKFI